jgi:raffinose/stachyose/melibiose transport system permease protein
MVVPGIAVWLIWQFIYSDQGIVNQFLTAIGQGDLARGWLNAPHTALGSLFMIGFPFVYPIAMLIFYAGLLQIPAEVHESARLDGARALRRFFAIDLPLVLGQIRLIVVLTVITVITQSYQIVLVLTGGGPGNTTMMPGLVLYNNAFEFQRLGYACAVGVAMFIVVLLITLGINRGIRSSTEFEAKG